MTDHRRDGVEYPDDQTDEIVDDGATIGEVIGNYGQHMLDDPAEAPQEPAAGEQASEGDQAGGEPETAAQPSEADGEKSTATT